MINNENSPALGGQYKEMLTGQEPVLKGVNSRIIVERDRAYLAGNLKVLVSMMSDAQLLRFRRWCLQVAMHQLSHTISAKDIIDHATELRHTVDLLDQHADTIEAQLEVIETAGLATLKVATSLQQPEAASWAARSLANMTNWDVVWVTDDEGGPAMAAVASTERQTAWRAQLRTAYLILLGGHVS